MAFTHTGYLVIGTWTKHRFYLECQPTSNVNNIKTKGQTFQYQSLLSERKQNVLIWSAYYRNESKKF
jgi:hypothetical protein